MREHRDVGSLLSALLLGMLAVLLILSGTGHHIPPHRVLLAAPFVLIALGALGLLLSSRRR
ncbi:hypothetical protein ACTQ49_01525 [Luteococcus sp. Sow4_B9]|uniref:hypothetical protein n=1 Tax=Luteococcus sp. Sow4_B9 TaxID=3438792 RepID=UPI003F99463A